MLTYTIGTGTCADVVGLVRRVSHVAGDGDGGDCQAVSRIPHQQLKNDKLTLNSGATVGIHGLTRWHGAPGTGRVSTAKGIQKNGSALASILVSARKETQGLHKVSVLVHLRVPTQY